MCTRRFYFCGVKKYIPYFKNKFIIATLIFLIFTLFLDENDIFTIISTKRKLQILENKKEIYSEQLNATTTTLKRLKYKSEVERFARENKFFKKDDEDIFVIFRD